jgi:PAS domain S-box-containing protein
MGIGGVLALPYVLVSPNGWAGTITQLTLIGALMAIVCLRQKTPSNKSTTHHTKSGCLDAKVEQSQWQAELDKHALFDAANVPIVVSEPNGTIIIANRSFSSLTGYSLASLAGRHLPDILRPSDYNYLNVESANEDAFREWVLVKQDGSEATITLSTGEVSWEGGASALQHVVRDITVEKQASESMRLYVQEVTKAQEEERKRIARELHDDTMQVLGALSRETDNYLRRNMELPTSQRQYLIEVREKLNQAVYDLRRFIQNLRPSVLDDLGLLPAVKSLLNELRDTYHIDTQIQVVGEERRFSSETEVLIFRAIQEAVNNIRRHSNASVARLTIAFEPQSTYITISDNGQGFEMPGAIHELPRSSRLGLIGIQERVRLLGGAVQMQSVSGRGTIISLTVPV